MEEWNDKLEELSKEIEDREDVETPETHYTISYSSPFVEENKRRNEVRLKINFLLFLQYDKNLIYYEIVIFKYLGATTKLPVK